LGVGAPPPARSKISLLAADTIAVFSQPMIPSVMAYKIISRAGTESFMVIVRNAVEAVAKIDDLSWAGHVEISVMDMDGNKMDVAVLRHMVQGDGHPDPAKA
jgi:hypothetical protein